MWGFAKWFSLPGTQGIALKQTFEMEGKILTRKANGYAQARQFNRLKKVVRRHRTILGKLIREIQRKMSGVSDAIQTRFTLWLERAQRIVRQQ